MQRQQRACGEHGHVDRQADHVDSGAGFVVVSQVDIGTRRQHPAVRDEEDGVVEEEAKVRRHRVSPLAFDDGVSEIGRRACNDLCRREGASRPAVESGHWAGVAQRQAPRRRSQPAPNARETTASASPTRIDGCVPALTAASSDPKKNPIPLEVTTTISAMPANAAGSSPSATANHAVATAAAIDARMTKVIGASAQGRAEMTHGARASSATVSSTKTAVTAQENGERTCLPACTPVRRESVCVATAPCIKARGGFPAAG